MADAEAYVDAQGHYLGHFDQANAPAGATLVPVNPTVGFGSAWTGEAWVYPPPIPPRPSPRDWLERLSPATQNAITAAAAKDTSGALLLWLLRAAGNPTIDVTSPETVAGVAALVNAGIITAQDQTTLLTP